MTLFGANKILGETEVFGKSWGKDSGKFKEIQKHLAAGSELKLTWGVPGLLWFLSFLFSMLYASVATYNRATTVWQCGVSKWARGSASAFFQRGLQMVQLAKSAFVIGLNPLMKLASGPLSEDGYPDPHVSNMVAMVPTGFQLIFANYFCRSFAL